VAALRQSAEFLGLEVGEVKSLAEFWRAAVPAWAALHCD
jgi:glutamyl-Q tRNA(Asp) synthetase